jgi:CubicO group peptidase (beta-lactamase class C family)
MLKKIFVLCLCTAFLYTTACSPAPQPSSLITSDVITDIITKYQQAILQQMQENNISGLAIAVVDDQNILWAEGFGYTDWDNHIPVTPNTLFSIQSMSKSFTATAAMFAAQDGLVDLDEPITTYLPNFHVNSIFEEHPEQKITLRMLLSHTAGFVHEAPYGSNYDHPPYDFEKHIASISDTWLKFPVGTRYGYSNLGVDLAGYILQVRSGKPFAQYVQEKVLNPLGMNDSTLDVDQIRANNTRAIGHAFGQSFRPAVDFLLIPSGGVWATAADMAHYLQFHINEGALDGTRLLGEDYAETMYTPPNTPAQYAYSESGYALGITVGTRHRTRRFQHGGGGFGFNSSMIWYPELKLGMVVLTNTELSDDFVVRLNDAVLDDIINKEPLLYGQRAQSAVRVEPAYPPDKKSTILFGDALQRLINIKALPEDEATEQRRSTFVGEYLFFADGNILEISDQNGGLAYSYMDSTNPLTEVQTGLFFTPYGDTVDFRGRTPTISNIPLINVDTRTLLPQIAFYAPCGLIFLSALFYYPLQTLIRRVRRKKASLDIDDIRKPLSPRLVWTRMLAALASFFSLFIMILILLTPNDMYILAYVPFPRPHVDLLWWQFALLSLPYASLFLAVLIALLVGLHIKSHLEERATYFYFLTIALALLAFNSAIVL